MVYIGKTRNADFYYNADQETVELARRLRKQMTPAEKILWRRLRKQNITSWHFRRQHPIGFYIADFYCHEARLVIEVDGGVHSLPNRKEHDENRDAEMEKLGIKILRFTNNEILNQTSEVVNTIEKGLMKLTLPPFPLPSKGRGSQREVS